MSEADRFTRRAFRRSMLFAVAFVGGLGLLAYATATADPPKPLKASCECCKCKSCACLTAIPEPMPMPRPPVTATAPAPKAKGVEPVSFEDALRDQIEGRPETIRSRRILNVLDMEDGPRRQRILHRMEHHAKAHLELTGEVGKIDWSAIDWGKVFDVLMKLLAMLLPLLLAL